jgi:F-box and leucine-rich repeat protein GRR1
MTSCTRINGTFLPPAHQNPLVRRVSIDSMHSPSLHIPPVRELRLGGCSALNTPEFTTRFVQQNWQSLRILDLTQCTRLQDADLALIIDHASRLRNLVLYKCTSLTDRGILSLLQLGKNLHYLHLGHCIEITDSSVVQLARHCIRLRYLDLASCARITDVSCVELGIHLEKLKRVGLVKCTNISDAGILGLVKGRARIYDSLERIHLSYCQRLTRYVSPPQNPHPNFTSPCTFCSVWSGIDG